MNETKIEQGLKENLSRLVQAQAFQNFIIAVIILNGIVLGLETSNRAMALAGPLLLAVDRLCLTVFIVEICLKLYALRKGFFRENWNVFDFLVVGISLVPHHGGLAVLRSLRVLQVMRLISSLPSIGSSRPCSTPYRGSVPWPESWPSSSTSARSFPGSSSGRATRNGSDPLARPCTPSSRS